MDELNAAPSSTEPADPMTDAEREALPDWVKNGQPPVQEAGTATSGEQSSVSGDTSASAENDTVDAPTIDAPAVGGGIDAPSHLLMLDAMLAEIERKIAAGIHLFAHEVTAARDHLAKLLP